MPPIPDLTRAAPRGAAIRPRSHPAPQRLRWPPELLFALRLPYILGNYTMCARLQNKCSLAVRLRIPPTPCNDRSANMSNFRAGWDRPPDTTARPRPYSKDECRSTRYQAVQERSRAQRHSGVVAGRRIWRGDVIACSLLCLGACAEVCEPAARIARNIARPKGGRGKLINLKKGNYDTENRHLGFRVGWSLAC